MEEIDSIGLVELSSVARGYTVEDAMIKAANVKIIMARTICSGKFLVAVAGDSDAVSAFARFRRQSGPRCHHRKAPHYARTPVDLPRHHGQRRARS